MSLSIMLVIIGARAQDYTTQTDVPYRTGRFSLKDPYANEMCKMDLYYPKQQKEFATIYWIHGGGLKGGAKFFPKPFLDQGIAVVAINYRLIPKATPDEILDDAAAGLAWVFDHIEEYGGSKQKVFVSGHSAGGYLVGMIALAPQYLKKYGVDPNDVQGYMPLSGQMVTHSAVRELKGYSRTQPIINEYAPAHLVKADTPPFVLITGGRDLDVPARFEENAYFKSLMDQTGNTGVTLLELQGFNHGTMVGPATSIVVEYVNKILKNK